MKNVAVEINNLDVDIEEHQILKDINLHLPKGKVIGLLGPSGAGKTTLIRTIVGLQKISSGNVEVLGIPAAHPSLRNKIGYMAQDPDVYTDLTVIENIDYFARLLGVDGTRVSELLSMVELEPQLNQLTSTLSGGQIVRLSLLVSLLGNPELVLLDEPTVGLDPVLRKKLWESFHGLAEAGSTVVVTSHVMDEARRCDHLVLIRNGKILSDESPEKMIKDASAKDMEEAFLTLIGSVK